MFKNTEDVYMARKTLKLIVVIALTLAVLTGTAIAATGTVTGNSVRIRNGASGDSTAITSLGQGEQVEVIGEEGNWYHIKYGDIEGYMSKDYIETDYSSDTTTETPVATETTSETSGTTENQTETSSSETTQTAEVPQTVTFENDTNLRYLPNFTSRVKAVATSGATYTVRGSLNNWVKVSNNINTGWVLKSVIDGTFQEETKEPEVPVSEEPEAPAEKTQEEHAKGRVIVESARVRETPDGEILGSLPEGTEVVILSVENDWYKINTLEFGDCYIAERLIHEL